MGTNGTEGRFLGFGVEVVWNERIGKVKIFF